MAPPRVVADPTARKRVRSKIYGLRTFPEAAAAAAGGFGGGAFRDNVREFVRECGDVEEGATAGMPTWCTLLVDERSGAVAPLYTVEECVRFSPRPLCDYCRCVAAGWGHHWVSKRRYHLIIPTDEEWDRPLSGDALLRNDHLLHGLIHGNGFGHLVTINGRSGGSKFLSGCDLMDLWDRICTALRVREVSVEDTSQKRSLALRLLLGVAYGAPWFARWGYRFAWGSFGVTEDRYRRAIHLLSSLPVDALAADLRPSPRAGHLRRVAAAYRRLSGEPLLAVRDLLRHLLDMKRRSLPPPLPPPPPRGPRKRRRVRDFEEVAAALESRWPARRLRFAAEVIVGALAEGGGAGRRMTRQEVRDAARLTIGDTGLIDFVLKSLGDCAVGGRVVRRAPHPLTRVLEFSLEDPAAEEEDEEEEEEEEEALPFAAAWPSQGEVERAVGAVYWGLVEGRREAAQAVLDCKHWAKRWGLGDEADDRLRFLVRWKPPGRKGWEEEAEAEAELSRRRPLIPPGEVVVVEAHAAVGELVAEAERAMRDTYCAFEWEPVMNGGAESGAELWVRGEFGAEAVDCELRREGREVGAEAEAEAEAEAWAVACACGASDDDGERMVACDACDVWHHTRCAGIADGDPVPPVFLCARCGGGLAAEAAVAAAAAGVALRV
ncbi:PHD finger protein MALE MEIOCYTE DEATH 1-like [Ananas comosus]|uniref:PHD finger protein MALE MEIOCYTE DEATH 1-like n=1 Tax=Ananas comosus TaxID=4615 RepID=A0A6P5FBV0_ANACO|nr:PHD finger protein MALE MEIOCYTE DEATH 1-like [Ananas comosus]